MREMTETILKHAARRIRIYKSDSNEKIKTQLSDDESEGDE